MIETTVTIIINQSQVGNNNKWVINLSKTNLTEGQKSVLAKGPNYAFSPRYIPNLDYITAIELVSHKLKEDDAGGLEGTSIHYLEELKYQSQILLRRKA